MLVGSSEAKRGPFEAPHSHNSQPVSFRGRLKGNRQRQQVGRSAITTVSTVRGVGWLMPQSGGCLCCCLCCCLCSEKSRSATFDVLLGHTRTYPQHSLGVWCCVCDCEGPHPLAAARACSCAVAKSQAGQGLSRPIHRAVGRICLQGSVEGMCVCVDVCVVVEVSATDNPQHTHCAGGGGVLVLGRQDRQCLCSRLHSTCVVTRKHAHVSKTTGCVRACAACAACAACDSRVCLGRCWAHSRRRWFESCCCQQPRRQQVP